ncbi:hypothetical protein ELG83_24410 (plasmid) [Rhizobium leguminosarum]|uniref:hypothetical protein n=1 Tax=Rhizobium TaxID=379 RepID=UPI0010300136|nr:MULTISPECIES: hypothetical protein [Rhizobium]MBY5378355.1 hypothetical protein [Rhizobium leguminosarum]MBY5416492.1 hypothetical protein [Rhizobium leguminosarum]TBF24930.1 hypothetical protein ELG88_34090 [Rhizobium leguminosarum]TBF87995.1 hypothetical protein ELG83_24410 [Rhizobium leguminosarum]WSH48647.1 hypothetical protein U8P77_35650 [Rhizobium johnstonii]
MRGNAQGPTNERAASRSRSAGEHNEKERCDAVPATGRDGEPAHGLTRKAEASSQAIAPQRDEHHEQHPKAEQGCHDDEEALWRKGIVAALLLCIVAVLYFALFSVMQVAQVPVYKHP